jgi:hypothetical protein
VTVSYKPTNPSVCVLEPGLQVPRSYVDHWLALGVLAGSVGLFGYAFAKYRRSRRLLSFIGRPTWREAAAPGAAGVWVNLR